MNKVEINLLRLDEKYTEKPDRKQEQTTIRVLPLPPWVFAIGIVILSNVGILRPAIPNDTSALNSVLHSILFGSRPSVRRDERSCALG